MELIASGVVGPDYCSLMFASSNAVHTLDPDLGVYGIAQELDNLDSTDPFEIRLTKNDDLAGYSWAAYWI